MKNLEEKKLLVKMMRAFGQPVDEELVESIEREEKLMEAFFGVKKEEPKTIGVIAPEILPDPIIKEPEPEVIVAEAAVEELPPQPEKPAETGVMPPEEVRVKQVSDYLTAISKLPSDSTVFRDKELGEVRKTLADLLKKVNTLSWGGGGTGIVRIGQADDFDKSYTDGYVLTWSNGMFRLLPAGASGNTLVTSNDGSVTVSPITGGYDLSIVDYIDHNVQNIFAYVTNDEDVTIHKGDPVYLYRATGNRPSVKLAGNLSDSTSAKTFGLAAENITAHNPGWVQTQGILTGVNTQAYAEGDTLYLAATVGTLTNTKPHAPNHLVYMGVVVRANQGQGQIYIKPQNGYELDEIHDVNINHNNPIAGGQTIVWNSTNSLWENRKYSYNDLTDVPAGGNGAQGTTGIQGSNGLQGAQGIQGITGSQGIQGITGVQGIQGIQGTTGSNALYYRKDSATTLTTTGGDPISTSYQSIFGLTNGVTVASNTLYEFEVLFYRVQSGGQQLHYEDFGFIDHSSTVTYTTWEMYGNRTLTSGTVTAAYISGTTGVPTIRLTPNYQGSSVSIWRIKGHIGIGTGGYIDPFIKFDFAPGGTGGSISSGAWVKLTPIGTSGSISIGTWS